jgi:hypothetical protein
LNRGGKVLEIIANNRGRDRHSKLMLIPRVLTYARNVTSNRQSHRVKKRAPLTDAGPHFESRFVTGYYSAVREATNTQRVFGACVYLAWYV